MKQYLPEGGRIHTAENMRTVASLRLLRDAIKSETVLEGRAVLCDSEHNLHVALGDGLTGVIPREEGARGIADGSVKDIALIARVNKPVCFHVTAITEDTPPRILLSRRSVQDACMREYITTLSPGDILPAKITHMEPFGAFADIGAGIPALLPIDSISVSRIPHPNTRFTVGQNIRAVVRNIDARGRVTLTHRELLGTWEENAAQFSAGETVPGIIRSVEPYGVFVELTPNLAGLAEYAEHVRAGQNTCVYIKSILPERMKIKLIIVDAFEETDVLPEIKYYVAGDHMDVWRYSPACALKQIGTVFSEA